MRFQIKFKFAHRSLDFEIHSSWSFIVCFKYIKRKGMSKCFMYDMLIRRQWYFTLTSSFVHFFSKWKFWANSIQIGTFNLSPSFLPEYFFFIVRLLTQSFHCVFHIMINGIKVYKQSAISFILFSYVNFFAWNIIIS